MEFCEHKYICCNGKSKIQLISCLYTNNLNSVSRLDWEIALRRFIGGGYFCFCPTNVTSVMKLSKSFDRWTGMHLHHCQSSFRGSLGCIFGFVDLFSSCWSCGRSLEMCSLWRLLFWRRIFKWVKRAIFGFLPKVIYFDCRCQSWDIFVRRRMSGGYRCVTVR